MNETHDLSPKTWGNDYIFTPIDAGQRGKLSGWHPEHMEPGDFVILRNGDDTTRYQITKIEWMTDPRDQFFADVTFAPR